MSNNLYSYNNLFDNSFIEKFINKYSNNLNVSDEYNNPLENWLNRLKKGNLIQEESNHETFRALILERVLGYKFEDWINEGHPGNDSRKVEWMIKKNNQPYIVIELKGCKINLDQPQNNKFSPVEQAFNYASKHGTIKWVVVSNYSEIRLYDKGNQKKFIKFKFIDFFDENNQINDKFLKSFLLIFSKFSLIENEIPSEMLEKSLSFKKEFEDEFYKLFYETKLMLIKEFNTFSSLNKIDSIHKAQLILNRFIFACFVEDKFLIPKNTIKNTILSPIKYGDMSKDKPRIWIRFSELFEDLKNGNKAKKIFGFGESLFNENLNSLIIRDYIEDYNFFADCKLDWKFDKSFINQLYSQIDNEIDDLNPIWYNLLLISEFDFGSDVDVNILGHIFENCVWEMEYLNNSDSNIDFNNKNVKNIVYTPKSITDAICSNAIISFLSKKNFNDSVHGLIEEYNLNNNIDNLYSKLVNIKILDPVCGSGAFLNNAIDILLNIHLKIYQLDKSYLKKYYNFSEFNSEEIRKKIILNNIYGVDLNEDFIELTKLSMCIKIAQRDENLPNLDNNFICGNSLISDKKYDEKAFDWEKNFEEVFETGGFDVVIGNPPYDQHEDIDSCHKEYFKQYYPNTYDGLASLYVYFFEKALNILKNNGILSFICSNKFIKSDYGFNLRKLILLNSIIFYNDDLNSKIFKKNVDILLIGIKKGYSKNNQFKLLNNNSFYPQIQLSENSFILEDTLVLELINKIKNKGILIKEFKSITIHEGIKSGKKEVFSINKNLRNELIKKDKKNTDIIKPVLRGKNIDKWKINYENEYIIFTRRGIEINQYPFIKEYLSKFKKELTPKLDNNEKIGRKMGNYEWYELQDSINFYKDFDKPKLMWGNISDSPKFAFDDNSFYPDETCYYLVSDSLDVKYILALLNSKLLFWYFKMNSPKLGKKGNRSIATIIKKLPLVKPKNSEEKRLIEIASILINLNNSFSKEKREFLNWLSNQFNFNIFKLKKEFYELEFADFYNEVKTNTFITREEYKHLEDEFNKSVSSINDYMEKINFYENNLDKIVYGMYNLNDDEIKIIEKSYE